MKKHFSIFTIITIVATLILLTSCMGELITLNEPYDMNYGIVSNEYKEINFTVASYNIQGGEATVQSIRGINKNIEDIGADIVGLQEVDNLSKRSGKQDFLSIFKTGVLNNVSFFPAMLKGFGETYGIATISKTPFSATHSFKLPYPYKYESASVEKRIIMRSLITIDGVQIAFYNTHLAYEEVTMPDGSKLRQAQMKFILELLKSDPCPYKIVTGDFNVLDFDEFDIFLDSGYQIVNNSNTKLDTYKGDDVDFLALDNIIYSSNLSLSNCGKYESHFSDHDMLYAMFTTLE